MIVRSIFWAVLASGLLAYAQGVSLPSPLQAWGGAALFGLLGGWFFRGRREWRLFWLCLIAAAWAAVVLPEVVSLIRSMLGFGPLALTLVRPFALTTSALLGYLALLGRLSWQARPEFRPLALALPLVLACLLLGNPGSAGLEWLPLVAVLGFLPWEQGEEVEGVWVAAPVLALQGLAMQCVAWGLILSFLTFAAEVAAGSVGYALFMGFSTGVTAWMLSGLVWGLSLSLEGGRGRAWVLRLSRGLFNVRLARREEPLSELEGGGGGARPHIDVGETLDRDSDEA